MLSVWSIPAARCCGHFFSHYPGARGTGRGIFYYKKGRHLFIIPAHRTTLPRDLVEGEGSDRRASEDAAATSFEGPDGIQPQPSREKQCIMCERQQVANTPRLRPSRGKLFISISACFLSLSCPGILAHQTDLLLILLWKLYTPQRLNSNLSKTERRKQTSQEAIMQNTRAIICAAVFMVLNLNRQC